MRNEGDPGKRGKWVFLGRNPDTNEPYFDWVPNNKKKSSETDAGTSYEEPPWDSSLLTPEEYAAQQKKIADKRAEDYQKSRPDIYD